MSKAIYINEDQGSESWLNLKLGVISGSNISRALAKVGTDTRNSYMMELVGQVATKSYDEIFGKAMDHGKANEETARKAYEFETGHKVEQIGFVYLNESKRVGVSPDGLIPAIKKGLEIKCPATSRVHADFLCNDKIKPEYLAQIQLSLWVTGFDSWDFCSYHPAFKSNLLKIVTVKPDAKYFERFETELGTFIEDMDKMLLKLNLSFGSQWS